MKKIRNVLMIAYYFPPRATSGVYRSLKFVKYLPQFGWNPYVLTVKPPQKVSLDFDLLKDIPTSAKIIRTPTGNFVNDLLVFLGRSGIRQHSPSPQMRVNSEGMPRKSNISKITGILKSKIQKWFFIPDTVVVWVPIAILTALWICNRRKIDVIYTTSIPYSAHVIGYILKRVTRKPWIADFRDEWTDDTLIDYPTEWHRKINVNLEAICLKKADKVITVSEPQRNLLKRKRPYKEAEKFVVVTNGYDPDDFKFIRRTNIEEFSILYAGALPFPQRDIRPFLQAVKEATEAVKELAEHLKVTFIGTMDSLYLQEIKKLNLEQFVFYEGYHPHKQAIEIMANSYVLLLVVDDFKNAEGYFTGKLFEYLAVRRPILALAPHGIVDDLIRDTGVGISVRNKDVKAIKESLLYFGNLYKQGKDFPYPAPELLDKFSRRNLTKRLAEILGEVTSINNVD